MLLGRRNIQFPLENVWTSPDYKKKIFALEVFLYFSSPFAHNLLC